MTPGGTIFDPRGIILSNLVEVHLVMLNTKYQGSLPCGFRHRVHGRGPLVDATYQISRQKALWFQRRSFFMFSLYKWPEFCLKLTYRYLLKAGRVSINTWGKAIIGPRGII